MLNEAERLEGGRCRAAIPHMEQLLIVNDVHESDSLRAKNITMYITCASVHGMAVHSGRQHVLCVCVHLLCWQVWQYLPEALVVQDMYNIILCISEIVYTYTPLQSGPGWTPGTAVAVVVYSSSSILHGLLELSLLNVQCPKTLTLRAIDCSQGCAH